MATERILRLRITNAAKEAEKATQRGDARAYYRAKAAYEAADAELAKLEAERNLRAIEELEAEAALHGGMLPYAAIVRSGVPILVLQVRGWRNIDGQAGMHKPRHLALVQRTQEPNHGAATSGDPGADEAGRPQAHEP